MRKAIRFIGALGLMGTLLFSSIACCAMETGESSKSVLNQQATNEKTVDELLASMTTREKVTQMIMPAFRKWSDAPGAEKTNVTELNSDLQSFIIENNFAGVCLFAENCQNTIQIVNLTNQLQDTAKKSRLGIPMFLSIDQEGGYVTRLATGTSGIGNMALAATNNPQNAQLQADIIGEELNALGINTDFAPDMDVNSNKNNTVIGVRSFSDNPTTVATYGQYYIKGLHENNVCSCMKHFPGHGDTDVDSHTGLPLITKSYAELKDMDLLPFEKNIANSDMIMAAHIQFPKIESDKYISKVSKKSVYLPATLSNRMIKGVLRNDMGYNGIV